MALTDAATKKVGPLPAWGWGAIAVGGFIAWRMFGSSGGNGTTDAGVASVGAAGGDSGGGGGGSGGGTDTSALQAALDSLTARINGITIPGTGGGGGGSGGGDTTNPTGGTPLPPDATIPQQLAATIPSFEDAPNVPAGWSASNPITVANPLGSWGQAVLGGPYAPTAKQLAEIEATGGLPTGISWGTVSGAYKVGSVAPAIKVDLSAPSKDMATYLQQLFAIESGAKYDPSVFPTEANVTAERHATIAQFVASIVGSGGAYQADFGHLTPDQIKAAANYGGPFSGINLNPEYAVALYNAANAANGSAPPAISGASQVNSPSVPAPSTSSKPAVMTLTQYNAQIRQGVIDRAKAAGNTVTTASVNQTVANDYAKYLAAQK